MVLQNVELMKATTSSTYIKSKVLTASLWKIVRKDILFSMKNKFCVRKLWK